MKPNFNDFNDPGFKQFRITFKNASKWLRSIDPRIDQQKLGARTIVRAYRKHGKKNLQIS